MDEHDDMENVNNPFIKLDKVSIDSKGRVWKLHTISFDTAEGHFSTYIYAVNKEHAAAIVEEMKLTLTLDGEIV